jgi:hypothetical protein
MLEQGEQMGSPLNEYKITGGLIKNIFDNTSSADGSISAGLTIRKGA